MKKKLESELISIAHRILKLKGKEDVDKMHEEVSKLYEKLTVLKFAQENFEEAMPTIGGDSSFFGMLDAAFNNTVSDNIEVDNRVYINLDDVEDDDIMEPVMEKIKDMVAHMPYETQAMEKTIDTVIAEEKHKEITFETIPQDYASMPEFEPLEDAKKREAEKKAQSLNDKLKGSGLQIGLNDKIAFIKHLFDNKSEDYHRVVGQINTIGTAEEAHHFLLNMVKPDYNNWNGKEDYETRFLELVENSFN